MIDSNDDYSRRFQELRPFLVNDEGLRYADFIKTLTPNYTRLYLDIALGYFALIVTFAFVRAVPVEMDYGPLFTVFAGAISIGFWIAYLQLFLHEGAHFNFASDRGQSDFLCNILVAWMIGTSVQQYRITHFQHHRALGKVDDSESTYFSALNLAFLIKALFGVRVMEVLRSRTELEAKAKRVDRGTWVRPMGLLAHIAIVTISFFSRELLFCAAWVLGTVMFFPLFGALRQLLEHRDPSADPCVDYNEHDHGAYTRVFGPGIFASVFGAAGFNRHLLHHWEPQVSYTNLHEMEAYLLKTELASVIEQRRSTYLKTFLSLFRFT